MSEEQKNTDRLNESAIYRLRWVADAMEAARLYAETHPEEAHAADANRADAD
jgi:hypothetical protein